MYCPVVCVGFDCWCPASLVCLNFNDEKGIIKGGRSCAGGESHRNRIRQGRMPVNSRGDGGGGGGGCTQRGARQEQEGGKGGASSYGHDHDDGAGASGAFWSWVSVVGAEIRICICSSAAGVTTGGHRQLATTGNIRPPRLPSDIRLVTRQVRSDAAGVPKQHLDTDPGARSRRN